jgi:hypothetical protein
MLVEQVFSKIDILTSGCWEWQGAHTKGRPVVHIRSISDSNLYVVRYLWEIDNGPVPDGKELHHTCEHPWCCNPAHVEPLTHREHLKKHRSRYCKRGHFRRRSAHHACLDCHRDRMRKRYAERTGL